ncbi:MAG: chorismate-binding protein, partial [Bacillota bacterium]|nr:chorismate-binding protein [Bacillota bacterium]
APKLRAMEIIDELENKPRGVYAGAILYFGLSGNMDSCIAIRTIVIQDKMAYVQAGAGIVNDSCPEAEYYETCNKAKALLLALGAYVDEERGAEDKNEEQLSKLSYQVN